MSGRISPTANCALLSAASKLVKFANVCANSWNNADICERLARVNAEWRAVLTEAFEEPRRQLGIELPLEALVSLVVTFNLGIIVERLGGIETGHRELLDWIDRWISR